jgi:hypothetical protein
MPSRRAALVLAFAALSGGAIGACGGGASYVDSVPKSTPDLTVPANGAGLPAPQSSTSTTSTSSTTTTPTTSTGTTTSSSPTTSSQGTSTLQTGGTGGTQSGGGTQTSTGTSTSNSGGTPAGGFSDFCKQNPGACGQ